MKRRRRNPRARKTPPHSRSLLRQALVQKLELDFMASRQYRSERSKTWQSASSSNSQELSAASSLDKYVKAVLGDDKCTQEKEDTSGTGTLRPRRNHTPASKDIDALPQGQRLISSSPLHMGRIDEFSSPAFPLSGEHADWTQHGHDHNHHQLSTLQIRDQGGGWENIRVFLDPSSRHSLVSEDTVNRLEIPLMPTSRRCSRSISSTYLGSVECKWWAPIQIRTSPDMSAVLVNPVSTKLLPKGWDMTVGNDLLDMLGASTALPFMSVSPGRLNRTSPGPWISKYTTLDPTWLSEDGTQFTQEHLDHSISQPDSNIGPSWSGLCGSPIELSNNFVQHQRQEPGVL